MGSASKEMVIYCFDTLVAYYSGDPIPPPAFDEASYPLFVTWKKVVNGGEPRLRGCIGTLEARNIIAAFKDYALTSALRDRRFPPIQAKEIPLLECTVSLLTDYEPAAHYLDWEIGKHGMVLEFTDPANCKRNATYLPEVAAHEVDMQIFGFSSKRWPAAMLHEYILRGLDEDRDGRFIGTEGGLFRDDHRIDEEEVPHHSLSVFPLHYAL